MPAHSTHPHRDACILVIEDDPCNRGAIPGLLEKEHYATASAGDRVQGLEMARRRRFALVILDVGISGLEEFTVCRQLTELTPRPLILVLSARSAEIDRVRALDCGADDYVAKPYGPPELLARVRALLRRRPVAAPGTGQAVAVGSLVIHGRERYAELGARRINLTEKECDLLQWLARHPQRVFTPVELLDSVWGVSFEGFVQTVRSHVNRLRSKIEHDPARPAIVVTIRGRGYKLVPPGPEAATWASVRSSASRS